LTTRCSSIHSGTAGQGNVAQWHGKGSVSW
jgi:hypothetical protein